LFGLEEVIAGDGGEGAEEQVAGVGHDGGAARRDLVAGLELIEFAERVIDGERVAELLDVPDESGGEVGLVEFFLAVCSVFGAEVGVRIRDGHAATSSAGSAVLTMERNRIGIGDGCSSLRVHESSFRWWGGMFHSDRSRNVPFWELLVHTPAVFVRVANKGVAGYGTWKGVETIEKTGVREA